MSITLSIITSQKEFKQYSKVWEKFRQQQNDNSICNSWEWLSTWLDVFWRPKDQLSIYIWYCKKEVVGVIPCYIKKTLLGNELRFVATGEPTKSEICSEFQDFILNGLYKEKILELFTNEIMAHQYISAIIFDNILTTSNAYEWLEKIQLGNWTKAINNSGYRYLISLKTTQKEQALSFRSKNIKRHAKKIISDTRLRILNVNDSLALDNFYRSLIKEHNASWRERSITGAFEQAHFVKFHQKYSEALLANNKLVAFKIECEDEYAALFYGMIDGNTLYYYQSAINHNSKLSSAGVAMHVKALDIARENNLAFYDLMKGSDNSYKKRYVQSNNKVVSRLTCTIKYKFTAKLFKVFQKLFMKLNRVR